jgi:hypothetical protein
MRDGEEGVGWRLRNCPSFARQGNVTHLLSIPTIRKTLKKTVFFFLFYSVLCSLKKKKKKGKGLKPV